MITIRRLFGSPFIYRKRRSAGFKSLLPGSPKSPLALDMPGEVMSMADQTNDDLESFDTAPLGEGGTHFVANR